eukprot:1695638-Pleurochrysis_carterae.AAC.1
MTSAISLNRRATIQQYEHAPQAAPAAIVFEMRDLARPDATVRAEGRSSKVGTAASRASASKSQHMCIQWHLTAGDS